MSAASLTIVLPAYNEEGRLDGGLDDLFGYLAQCAAPDGKARSGSSRLADDVRVLVVDDGSSDATAKVVAARPETGWPAGPRGRLALLRRPHRGKGAAVRAGMLAADSELVVFADADMATPPRDLGKLVDALADADVALGSRIQPDGSDMRHSQPAFRRLLGRVFRRLASTWVVGPVADTQCGFKGFRCEAAHDLFARQQITSIVFDVEIIHLARKRGYRIAVVPIHWSDRMGSRMRFRVGLALRVGWDLLRIPWLHRRVGRRGGAEAVRLDGHSSR
jgi:glycosyltransferase involved in cell wall biosynthesis